MELMCAHIFHTECLVIQWYDEMDCPSCHAHIFTPQVRDAVHTRDQDKRKKNEEKFLEEYNKNLALRQDIKAIKKHIAPLRKAKAAFCKFGRQLYREWKQDIHPLIQLLKMKQKEKIRTVEISSELKAWRSERTKITRLVNRFERKYTQYRFHELLHYPSLKLPTVYDYRNLSSIYSWTRRRYFRFYW